METTAVVAGAIEGVALNGVLTEVVALIPVVAPICLTYLAIRKGWSFLMGSLSQA